MDVVRHNKCHIHEYGGVIQIFYIRIRIAITLTVVILTIVEIARLLAMNVPMIMKMLNSNGTNSKSSVELRSLNEEDHKSNLAISNNINPQPSYSPHESSWHPQFGWTDEATADEKWPQSSTKFEIEDISIQLSRARRGMYHHQYSPSQSRSIFVYSLDCSGLLNANQITWKYRR